MGGYIKISLAKYNNMIVCHIICLKKNQLNHDPFICQCDSIEHSLSATYDEQEALEPWVSLSVHLKQFYPWYKRIWSSEQLWRF